MKNKLFYFYILFAVILTSYSFNNITTNLEKPFIVVLDAGHGGHDPGNLGNGYKEKDIALSIVLEVGKILEKQDNFKVIYTRKTDVFIKLHERAPIANKADADLFVSIHCDAFTNNAYGAGTFVLGLHPTSIRVCTFHSNKFKSYNILANNTQITNNSLKTFNFVNNIAYLNNDFLTVDIWHLRACFNNMIKINSATIGKIAYEQIKQLTLKKAAKLGLKGFEFQAILWLSAQTNINNN